MPLWVKCVLCRIKDLGSDLQQSERAQGHLPITLAQETGKDDPWSSLASLLASDRPCLKHKMKCVLAGQSHGSLCIVTSWLSLLPSRRWPSHSALLCVPAERGSHISPQITAQVPLCSFYCQYDMPL